MNDTPNTSPDPRAASEGTQDREDAIREHEDVDGETVVADAIDLFQANGTPSPTSDADIAPPA